MCLLVLWNQCQNHKNVKFPELTVGFSYLCLIPVMHGLDGSSEINQMIIALLLLFMCHDSMGRFRILDESVLLKDQKNR